jgi:hypothetical protein
MVVKFVGFGVQFSEKNPTFCGWDYGFQRIEMRLPSPVLTVAGSEDVCRATAVLSPSVVGLSCHLFKGGRYRVGIKDEFPDGSAI